jgi:hypothetical protein
LDYVTRIDAAELNATNGDAWLVVVVSGRATGRRSTVAVLSPDYEKVYEERVERFWNLPSPLEIHFDAVRRQEVAVIGPCCSLPIVLTLR